MPTGLGAREGPAPPSMGESCSVFSVATGEVLCSGRNTEDLRRKDMQDLSLRWLVLRAGVAWASESRAW